MKLNMHYKFDHIQNVQIDSILAFISSKSTIGIAPLDCFILFHFRLQYFWPNYKAIILPIGESSFINIENVSPLRQKL